MPEGAIDVFQLHYIMVEMTLWVIMIMVFAAGTLMSCIGIIIFFGPHYHKRVLYSRCEQCGNFTTTVDRKCALCGEPKPTERVVP